MCRICVLQRCGAAVKRTIPTEYIADNEAREVQNGCKISPNSERRQSKKIWRRQQTGLGDCNGLDVTKPHQDNRSWRETNCLGLDNGIAIGGESKRKGKKEAEPRSTCGTTRTSKKVECVTMGNYLSYILCPDTRARHLRRCPSVWLGWLWPCCPLFQNALAEVQVLV